MKKVGVIMGSDSDLPVVEKAIDKLKEYGVPYEVHVYSAHRTPAQAGEFSRTAQEKGFGVIIAAAGKAAHLAGSLAANTVLPVIGIPVKSSTLDGLDALLSTVQMPTGIPVATVAIDGGRQRRPPGHPDPGGLRRGPGRKAPPGQSGGVPEGAGEERRRGSGVQSGKVKKEG